MSAQEQMSGKPWSGTNKIPTISQFVESLDRDKKHRDEVLENQSQGKVAVKNEDIVPHKNEERLKGLKQVSDPVTGGQVMISDVSKEYMENATNPKVG